MKELNIFTYSFPYGKGEQFLYEEILLLSKKYDKINLFPAVTSNKNIDLNLPQNVAIYNFESATESNSGNKNIGLLGKVLLEEFKVGTHFFKYLTNIRHYRAHLSNAVNQSDKLLAFLKNSQINLNATFYTYWFNDWTYKLALLKERKKIKHLVTRIHGGDVYEYQHVEKNFFFPFRNFQIKQIDKIFAISQDGLEHLAKNYPSSAPKLKLSRLGTKDQGVNPSKTTNDSFILASCSTFYHYKNLEFIPEILSHITFPLTWIHIGDEGPEKEKVMQFAKTLPSHIKIDFKGNLSQKEVFNFYRTNYIDLFINVSKSEGLPVALMEAISFGIPIMAPNVGGIKEIANSKTGILFELNTKAEELAKKITSIYTKQISIDRKEVREYWGENFNSEKNFSVFANELNLLAN